jgi:hypothetical protein
VPYDGFAGRVEAFMGGELFPVVAVDHGKPELRGFSLPEQRRTNWN